jgi:hypothetical protein
LKYESTTLQNWLNAGRDAGESSILIAYPSMKESAGKYSKKNERLSMLKIKESSQTNRRNS